MNKKLIRLPEVLTAEEVDKKIHEFLGVPRQYLLRKRGLYYRPNGAGYTAVLEEAGRYSETDAKAEEKHSHGDVKPELEPIPRYSEDVAAIILACGKLRPDHQCAFIEELETVIRIPENLAFGKNPEHKFKLNHFGRFYVANASAAQRTAAFIRLIRRLEKNKTYDKQA